MSKDDEWPTLHVYPAYIWHDPVTILGTPSAFRQLSAKLLEAAEGDIAIARACANDGECYGVVILRVDDLDDRPKIRPPYVSEHANGPVLSGTLPTPIRRRIARALEAKQGDGR